MYIIWIKPKVFLSRSWNWYFKWKLLWDYSWNSCKIHMILLLLFKIRLFVVGSLNLNQNNDLRKRWNVHCDLQSFWKLLWMQINLKKKHSNCEENTRPNRIEWPKAKATFIQSHWKYKLLNIHKILYNSSKIDILNWIINYCLDNPLDMLRSLVKIYFGSQAAFQIK